ncbi:MAG: flagellar basal-body MS-ring/collar protein FliF [Alphaproteobacteria bacterium]|nr:flagellar basal-body MS-ring/collar protein FliF [Alphaproteobacteria bacterium]
MNALFQTLKGLGLARLILLGGVGIASIAFLMFVSSRLSAPAMVLLYAELDIKDSNQIIAKLETANVPYKLRANGTQIFVPSDKALRMRMTLAQEGLPRGGSVGYEIFDRSEAVGSSSFVQKINRLRALEGELARTISSMVQVRTARIHLVMPRRQLFARDKQVASASIVVQTYRGARLSSSQVLAIQHLVAAAVPGLRPDRISIVDGRGNLLARGTKEGATPQMAARNSNEMRRAYETRLARKIETIIGRSIGSRKVRAQVTASMDFDRITIAMEDYDPDRRVVRSIQTIEEKSIEKNSSGNKPVTAGSNLRRTGAQENETVKGSSREKTKTRERVNYEITKTVRNEVRITGTVKRLSVAVLIDGTYSSPAAGSTAGSTATKPVYKARSKEDIAQITALVRSAIGFDAKRGDVVKVVNMKFSDGAPQAAIEDSGPFLGMTKDDYMRAAEVAILAILALLVLMIVIRPLMRRLLDSEPFIRGKPVSTNQDGAAVALTGPDGTERLPPPKESDMIDIAQVEGRVQASAIKKVGDIVDNHPEETVAIMRNWMYEEA